MSFDPVQKLLMKAVKGKHHDHKNSEVEELKQQVQQLKQELATQKAHDQGFQEGLLAGMGNRPAESGAFCAVASATCSSPGQFSAFVAGITA